MGKPVCHFCSCPFCNLSNHNQMRMTMKMFITMMTSTCWKPVLASSVKTYSFRVYSDSSCSTPMGWCDSFSDKRCRLSMDECHAGGPDGKMKKHVEKNNKIYEQVWSNSATCSGAPTTETEELGGATVSSANCTRRDSAWYKDLTIEQVPANQCAVLRFFSGTACDQPLGSGIGSTCSNKVMGANPVCGPVSSGFKTQPNVPGSAVSLLRICKNKKDLILLYETADCAGCPTYTLDYWKDFGCKTCEVNGIVRQCTFQCENAPDTTSQHCLAPTTNTATGKSRFLLAVLMLGGLTSCMF